MSFRFGTPLLAGAYHFGNRGLGVLGSQVPSTGEHGPGYVYNDLSLPADAGVEVMGRIESTTLPDGTLTTWEDTSFSIVGAPDGTYTITYRLFADGVDLGTATITIYIGSSAVVSISTDAAVFSGSADSTPAVSGSCSFSLTTDAATFAGSCAVGGALPRYTITAKARRLTLAAREPQ